MPKQKYLRIFRIRLYLPKYELLIISHLFADSLILLNIENLKACLHYGLVLCIYLPKQPTIKNLTIDFLMYVLS